MSATTSATTSAAGAPAARSRGLIDVAVVTLALLPGVVAFGPVFGGLTGYLAAGAGAAVGVALALAALRWRWALLELVAAAAGAYLLLGGAVALPGTTLWHVVPTLETLQRLVLLVAQAWKDLLTVGLPASAFTGPAVVPWLAGLVCAVAAARLAGSPRWYVLAPLPVVAFLLVGILWGTHAAPWALAQGAVVAVVCLTWLSAKAARVGADADADLLGIGLAPAQRRRSRVPVQALVVTAVAASAAVGLGVVATPSSRHVLRDTVVPPLDMRQFATPLTLFRGMERDERDDVLFSVKGLGDGQRIRLAAVDAYDGIVYNVDAGSSGFERVGSTVEQEIERRGDLHSLQVKVGKYDSVWLPGGGELAGLTFDDAHADDHAENVYYNHDTGTALTTAALTEGTTYRVDLRVPPAAGDLSSRSLMSVSLPENSNVPEPVSAVATKLVGPATTPYDQAKALAEGLRKAGFYSDGSDGRSRSGHSKERITTLLNGRQWIGDDEQYAVAMALMARSLGLPARVVMGFYPSGAAQTDDGWVPVHGSEAHVWVEIPFAGVGWVPFDPTPDRSKTPQTDIPQPRRDLKPQVLPPPDPATQKPDLTKDSIEDQRGGKGPTVGGFPWHLVAWTAGGVGALALLLLPFVLVLALKGRRRRRRRHQGAAADRIGGSWFEMVDLATDLGTRLDHRLTRREMSQTLASEYPQAGVVAVAERIDDHVFGPFEPEEDEVARMWKDVEETLARMSADVGRWRRWRARFSLRSLRGSLTLPRPPRPARLLGMLRLRPPARFVPSRRKAQP